MFLYGRTLSIPTIFVSYTGETLDTKSPLLKALKAVDVAATKVCQLFDKDIQHVNSSLGPEQEYFADGTTDELITELAKIRALRVISRTSVQRYKRARKLLHKLAAN